MEIRHLQVVAEIVRQGSFTKAAEAMHITQPTISKMVRNLENELGAEVFARDGKQAKLTAAGEAIVRYAEPILQLFGQLKTEIGDLTYLNSGSIQVGLPPMAGSHFFPKVIKKFQERYPGISLRLVEDGASRIEASVADGALDVGVVLWPIDTDTFESFPLVQERLRVIMHPGHRLANRRNVELAELAEESFVLFGSGFALHDRIIAECRSVGFEPRIVHESSQWDFIGQMVAEGLGIAMLPDTICKTLGTEKVSAVPLINPVIPWELVMAWRREGYQSLAAREWIRFTKELFAEEQTSTGMERG
ncbi:LysR family transcriptional regulator [Cohnella sp. AR92]|uniref:LysR family transcriptional regulator n=1 Tax=Cohnella sp. AR92 TaxID=648716 RepID=UPI000F8CC8D2|nr:LysR family transcriptional regulator [Cohnella sp. AR92]RUS45887.1 LysR family transcriptional regulator [Cohnella sp. AR92]